MKYTVRMDSRTRKALDRLPGDMHGRVMRKLEALEENPRPFGAEKLTWHLRSAPRPTAQRRCATTDQFCQPPQNPPL
jgi:hypothetical protein